LNGSTLDVWAPSEDACTAFGRQRLQVWRLNG
jgi:3D (Asp-Asp-Asp) domain-containing protein